MHLIFLDLKHCFGFFRSTYLKPAILGLLIFVIAVVNSGSLSLAQDVGQTYYLKSDKPFGSPYGEWIINYWNWWANLPEKISPISHNYSCFVHDDGKSVYLVDVLTIGHDIKYSCEIPSNRSIFVPIVTTEYDNGLADYRKANDAKLIGDATKDNDGATFKFSLDGQEIPQKTLEDLRTSSPYWNITIVPDNQFSGPGGEPPGTWRAIAEGYYIILKPLNPGNHTINYEAKSISSLSSAKGVYNLVVNSSLDKAVTTPRS